MTQHTCFWLENAPAPKSYLNKPLLAQTDALVIGGGFTGTSAALQLARGGARVTLLEAKTIAQEASGRNGGQALSCLHHTLTDLVHAHGQARARDMFLAATQASDTVDRIITEEKIECAYVRSGNIEAASKPAHFESLKHEQETLFELANYAVELVPKNEISTELGTEAYHGLMINPRSGLVQPAKFAQGMALAAERAGAEIHEGTRVCAVEHNKSTGAGYRFTVKTERGNIAAKEILLAANAWTGKLIPQLRQRVFPAESFIIATAPLPKEMAQHLIPNNRAVYDTKRMLAYYRLSADNRMIWGGEGAASGLPDSINLNTLRRGMIRVFPELTNMPIDYFWRGTLGLTLDRNAHAGQINGMWFSMCYVGHGVTLATYLGEQMANAILGKASNNPFADLNMPRVPFYEGKAWFVNFGRAWFRLLDMFD